MTEKARRGPRQTNDVDMTDSRAAGAVTLSTLYNLCGLQPIINRTVHRWLRGDKYCANAHSQDSIDYHSAATSFLLFAEDAHHHITP